MRISICIATHERPESLRRTLAAIERQKVPPYEVVISDSSRIDDCALDRELGSSPVKVTRVRSESRALPWQRSWALHHSSGDVILFLDDDIVLSPLALETLERAYASLSAKGFQKIAGIGFRMVYDDGTEPSRRRSSFRERWLGMSGLAPGSLTAGGLTVSIAGLEGRDPVEVDVLAGGAMSFRREALSNLPLGNLVSLYEAGIGRGEDAVLSCHARRAGKLFVLTEPLAVHPAVPMQVATPYAKEGWRLGLTGTLGRAHTMRWMASNWSAYKRAWRRLVLLEVARSGKAVVSRPWHGKRWLRLAGTLFGFGLAVVRWSKIPKQPN